MKTNCFTPANLWCRIIQLILSLLLHNVWDIPIVFLTSQVQHFVVLILMVATDLDVTEVEVAA